MTWGPAAKVNVLIAWPLAFNATFAASTVDVAVSVKVTAPVVTGEAPAVTVAVNVCAAPYVTVAAEGASEVVVEFTAAFTAPDVPVIDGVTVSVAVRVWLPEVFSVAENVRAPLVKVELAGNIALPSLLAK